MAIHQVRVDLNSVMLNVDHDEFIQITRKHHVPGEVMKRILIAIQEEGKHIVASIEEED